MKYSIFIVRAMYCPEQDGEVFGRWEFDDEESAKFNLKFYAPLFPNLLMEVRPTEPETVSAEREVRNA